MSYTIGDTVKIVGGKRKGESGVIVAKGREDGRWKIRLVTGKKIDYPETKIEKIEVKEEEAPKLPSRRRTNSGGPKKKPPPPPSKGSKPPPPPGKGSKPKKPKKAKKIRFAKDVPPSFSEPSPRQKEMDQREERLRKKREEREKRRQMEEVEDFRRKVEEELEAEKEAMRRKLKAEQEKLKRQLERERLDHKRKLEEDERDFRLRMEEEREKNEDKIRDLEEEAKEAKIAFRKNQRKLDRERKDIENERRQLEEERERIEEENRRQDIGQAEEERRLKDEIRKVKKELERQRRKAEEERELRLSAENAEEEKQSELDDEMRRVRDELERVRDELKMKDRALRENKDIVSLKKSQTARRNRRSSLATAPVQAKDLQRLDGLVDVMNNLMEAQSRLGEDSGLLELSLPRIAVIGGQSAGKSSVLEALVGKGFLPRGSGICTRRPLILQMVADRKCRRDYGMFAHLGNKKFYDFAEVSREIVRETERLTGGKGSVTISTSPIILKVVAKDVLNLTLVDLPGMTRVAIRGQPKDMPDQLRNMCLKFIEDPNTIILAVSAANQDLAVSDAIKLAKKVDPKGDRTLGVLTKLDLMDAGTDALSILSGNGPLPLKLGYIGVVNRSQLDLNNKVSVDVMRKKEMDYFLNHRSYKLIASKQGVGHLATVLNGMLLGEVEKQIPMLKRQISEFIKQHKTEMESVEAVPDDEKRKRTIVTRILQEYAANIKNSIKFRSYRHGDKSDDSYSIALQHGALLREDINAYAKELAQVNIVDLASPAELSKVVGNTVGTGLFSPNDAFFALIKRGMERMRAPSQDLVMTAHAKLLSMLKNEAPTTQMGRFASLGMIIIRLATELLETCIKDARDAVNDLVDMELALINTEHPDFAGSKRKLGQIIAKISNEVMEESQAKRRRMMIDLDEEDEEYADYGGVTTPSEGRRARVQVVSEMTKEEKDDEDGEDAPPPLPTRRRGGGSTRSAPPSPPKTSIADRVLFSGILERKSNSMFSSSWKQQWVQLTGNRELRYWNTSEIPDDDEEPYRVLKLKGTKLKLGEGFNLKNEDFPNNPEYDFRSVATGAAGNYKVVAPFGVGWRKGPDYDDRYDDGIRGPDAGAEIRASKAKDVYDKKLDDTITFVYVDDDDASGEHGGWLPNTTRTGEKILARVVQDVEKVLVMLCSDKKYAEWKKEQKSKMKRTVKKKEPTPKAASMKGKDMKTPRRNRRRKVRSLFEVEEIEKRMLRTLILSYYSVIQKKITDSVPKIVSMTMISKLCSEVEKKLYTGVLPMSLKTLLGDGDSFAERRDRIRSSLRLIEKVKDAISALQMAGAISRT